MILDKTLHIRQAALADFHVFPLENFYVFIGELKIDFLHLF